ncbi:MAG: hypothetical protein ACLUSV_00610 [Streptococcus sp.]
MVKITGDFETGYIKIEEEGKYFNRLMSYFTLPEVDEFTFNDTIKELEGLLEHLNVEFETIIL